jgi:DNA-binding transcriptional LysR family regulator
MAGPVLSDLAAFVAVATRRSFRVAAVELGVSPSAVSHAIRGLEERLGVRLLNRTTRSVAPTEAGERLLARLQPAFRDIADAVEDVNAFRETPVGTLRLNLPRAAAPLILAPVMGRFLRENPGMQLEVVADDGLVDIVSAGFDAGIRLGERLERDMVAVRIGSDQRFAVVGSPAYFKGRKRPRTPHDLRDHACIRYRFPSGAMFRWRFAKNGEALEIDVDGPITLGDQELMVSAALDGIGLAFAFEGRVQHLVRQRRLVRVLADWCPPFEGFFLYYPSRRQVPAGLRAFIDVVKAERAKA